MRIGRSFIQRLNPGTAPRVFSCPYVFILDVGNTAIAIYMRKQGILYAPGMLQNGEKYFVSMDPAVRWKRFVIDFYLRNRHSLRNAITM